MLASSIATAKAVSCSYVVREDGSVLFRTNGRQRHEALYNRLSREQRLHLYANCTSQTAHAVVVQF